MLNQIRSTFPVPSPRSEARALVEAFAKQDEQRLYPFKLQNFTLGVKFQNADPQTQRVIVMTMLAWLDQHSLKSYGRQDQNAWQMGWKMREAFLHMLQFKIPFQEQDLITMLDWSASQSSTSAYVYFSGVPQIIKVVGDYLKSHPMSRELQQAAERLIQSIEAESMSVEIRRWILRLKDLIGETEVSLPLAAGDAWADTALKEIYSLDSRTRTAWAELLLYCSRAKSSVPSNKWLSAVDPYIDTIGNLNFFIKLLHWFPVVEKQLTASTNRHDRHPSLLPVNSDILKGLIWLCGKSDDPEIARALANLAISSHLPGIGRKVTKLGSACIWALGNMSSPEAILQLKDLKLQMKSNPAQKSIAQMLQRAAKRLGMNVEEIEELSVGAYR